MGLGNCSIIIYSRILFHTFASGLWTELQWQIVWFSTISVKRLFILNTSRSYIGRVLDFPQRLQGSLSFGTAHYFSPGKGIKGHFGGIIGFLGWQKEGSVITDAACSLYWVPLITSAKRTLVRYQEDTDQEIAPWWLHLPVIQHHC